MSRDQWNSPVSSVFPANFLIALCFDFWTTSKYSRTGTTSEDTLIYNVFKSQLIHTSTISTSIFDRYLYLKDIYFSIVSSTDTLMVNRQSSQSWSNLEVKPGIVLNISLTFRVYLLAGLIKRYLFELASVLKMHISA